MDAKHAVGHVNWGLLVLIGSALGFSKSMANSGLADYAGRAVRESGMSESASLYALFGLTMVRLTDRTPFFFGGGGDFRLSPARSRNIAEVTLATCVSFSLEEDL